MPLEWAILSRGRSCPSMLTFLPKVVGIVWFWGSLWGHLRFFYVLDETVNGRNFIFIGQREGLSTIKR